MGFGCFGYRKVTALEAVVLTTENLPHKKRETLPITGGLAKLGGEVIVRISVVSFNRRCYTEMKMVFRFHVTAASKV